MSKKDQAQAGIPYSLEAERTVLGCILLGEKQWLKMLTPGHFHESVYGLVFKTLQEIASDGKEPDFLELSNALRNDESIEALGGIAFIAQLAADVTTTSMAPSAVRILQEKLSKRGAIEAGRKLIGHGQDDRHDVRALPQLLSEASRRIAEIIPRQIEVDTEELITELQTVDDKLATGFPQMDALLEGGLEAGWLFLIAARPSVGKSAMATTLVGNFLKAGVPVSLVSLEMSRKQVMKRVLAAYFDVYPTEAVEKANEYVPRIKTPYYIHTGSSDISAILQEIYTSPAKIIIIDYFGLITMKSKENRFQQMDEISRSIKNAAMEAKKPIILLTQLNREVEKDKANRQPRLSDLWGGGEKDADQISFLHDPAAKEELGETAQTVNVALGDSEPIKDLEWILRKNRHGPTGYLKLQFERKKFLMRDDAGFTAPARPTPSPKSDGTPRTDDSF